MKCKGCGKEIDTVLVVSKCTQIAFLEEKEIVDYGSVDDILETLEIVCRECGFNLSGEVER